MLLFLLGTALRGSRIVYFYRMLQVGNPKKELIWLVGYMGAGKSTVARLLADRLGAGFTDSDEWIAERSGKTIPALFKEKGEAAFRDWERQCAEYLAGISQGKHVVACGGGMPCYTGLIDSMLAHGSVVYLEASPGLLAERLFADPAERPLIKGLNREALEKDMLQRLAERIPVYRRADLTVRTDGKTPEAVVREIIALLDLP